MCGLRWNVVLSTLCHTDGVDAKGTISFGTRCSWREEFAFASARRAGFGDAACPYIVGYIGFALID
jgi:hypothetical protein